MLSKSYTHPSRSQQGMSVAYGNHAQTNLDHNQPAQTGVTLLMFYFTHSVLSNMKTISN